MPQCSFNCENKTSKEERQEVWDEFRTITDMNVRLQYLANLIEIMSPVRARPPKSSTSKSRSCVNKYYLRFNEYLNNSGYQVCKVCFMTVFNVTASKIRTVVEKKLREGDDIQYNRGKKITPVTFVDCSIKSEDNFEGDNCFNIKIEAGNEIRNTIENVIENTKVKRNKPSKKGETQVYRTNRKIKNLGIDREFVPDLPTCSLDCQNRIAPEERQLTWDQFRKIVNMNERLKYLANLIQIKPVSHVKAKEEDSQQKRTNVIFHLKWNKNARNARNRLCKVCFMTVFNLTSSKVRTIIGKKFKKLELEYNRGKQPKSYMKKEVKS